MVTKERKVRVVVTVRDERITFSIRAEEMPEVEKLLARLASYVEDEVDTRYF